jgi:hypothetical protein
MRIHDIRIFRALVLIAISTNWSLAYGQTVIPLINPSIEDVPRAGGMGLQVPINGWYDFNHFPKESPPDIHSAVTRFWEVSTAPYDGVTFLGLVTRPNGTYEGVFQYLRAPLEEDAVYVLSIFLCQDARYFSPLASSRTITFQKPAEVELVAFTSPVIVRIWGSYDGEYGELLSESTPVDHPDWREYVFDLLPTKGYPGLIVEVYFADEEAVAGHVLIDKLTLVKI